MPWSRLDDTWYDHPKLMELPARLRNAGAGLRDRALSWSNRHLADGHVPNAVLRTLNCAPDLRAALIAVGLFHDEGTGVVIHDYTDYNETRAELLERRAKAAKAGRLGGLAKKRNASDPLSIEPIDPLAPASQSLPQSLAEPATNARPRNAPAIAPPPGRNARPVPSPVPSDSPSRENRSTTAEPRGPGLNGAERADIQALLDRGWKRVTAKQRSTLDEVLDRHDVTGPDWAARVIRNTPADADPLADVMAADRAWQAEQRERADREDARWAATKRAEAELAAGVLEALT
jgi:hypothetical protein